MDISDFVNIRTIEKVTEDLVKRCVKRRKEKKFTQKQLSINSGVSYASIRRFEKQGDISFISLLKIANALDFLTDFDKLCTGIFIKKLKEYVVDD